MIIWFTGNRSSGKTTLAKAVCNLLPSAVHLDGNELRASISTDCGFSADDQVRHNVRIARLANILYNQGHVVIVSATAPFRTLRRAIDSVCKPTWIYVRREGLNGLNGSEWAYEPPITPDTTIDNSFDRPDYHGSIRSSVAMIARTHLSGAIPQRILEQLPE